MDGSEKITPLVIGKSAKPRCFKGINSFPTKYHSDKKAWMTTELFNEWLISLNSDMKREKRHILLFLDNCFPSPNLVDVDDTLTEFNAEPSLWEALPEQDLTFDDYVLIDTDIAAWGALSDAEIVALDYNNTESDEDESEELTPVTLSEAKVSLNKLRNFFIQNHVDADILQASFVLEKSIDKVRLNALKQKKITDFFDKKDYLYIICIFF
ncbi:tigger transposable element-derived protein 6 [Trichonephila clavipes]|nr:tigger transposable element-derived protein 6 [Trichonephila clavipes]